MPARAPQTTVLDESARLFVRLRHDAGALREARRRIAPEDDLTVGGAVPVAEPVDKLLHEGPVDGAGGEDPHGERAAGESPAADAREVAEAECPDGICHLLVLLPALLERQPDHDLCAAAALEAELDDAEADIGHDAPFPARPCERATQMKYPSRRPLAALARSRPAPTEAARPSPRGPRHSGPAPRSGPPRPRRRGRPRRAAPRRVPAAETAVPPSGVASPRRGRTSRSA